jgi:L-threonylcarbamoyladenylate synthase
MVVVLKTSAIKPDLKAIDQAVKVLYKGGLIVYPTDTAYGLGGNALDIKVIKKVYETKGRDHKKPTHIIVKDWKMIKEISKPSIHARLLFDNYFPGPLTVILRKDKRVPNILTSNLKTIGIRIPDCAVTKLISEKVYFPYTTPSANRSRGNTPYSIKEVANEIDLNKIDLVIDCGTLAKTKPSTIIDLTTKPPKVLRDGPISRSKIEETLNIKLIS